MVRETMALRATLEPRFMRAMATPKTKETTTALRGMFQPGLTCVIVSSFVVKGLGDGGKMFRAMSSFSVCMY